jgi:hypothetical protein
MCYNPKFKSIAEAVSKDVNKNAIKKLGKKFNTKDSMAPFFIKADHEFADGKVAPLFVFGKIKHLKSELKKLKGATEQHGMCFVEYDAKGVPTLCLRPSIGKLSGKDSVLKKAMKDAFTSSYAQYKILEPIDEKEMDAAMEAAEAEADEAEDADDMEDVAEEAVAEAKAETQAPKTETNAADKKVSAELATLATKTKSALDTFLSTPVKPASLIKTIADLFPTFLKAVEAEPQVGAKIKTFYDQIKQIWAKLETQINKKQEAKANGEAPKPKAQAAADIDPASPAGEAKKLIQEAKILAAQIAKIRATQINKK